MSTAPTVRQQVAQREAAAIASNVARIEADKARPSALAALASRLNISEAGLAKTLKATVFRGASDDEFAALVVVANAYKLNPLTKEMYAFPQKGGGIVPLVSIDGWIRIMNDHPQFDGIEFEDVADDQGKLLAIDATIWRKDRVRPTRIREYLAECRGTSAPWQKSPARFLRHRALIQCTRVAFGFSGIYTEEDIEAAPRAVVDNGPPPMRQATLPRAAAIDAGGGEVADPRTGELARDDDYLRGDLSEGRGPEDMGEAHYDQTGREIDPREEIADRIIAQAKAATTIIDLNSLKAGHQDAIDAFPDEIAGVVNKALRDADARLRGGK